MWLLPVPPVQMRRHFPELPEPLPLKQMTGGRGAGAGAGAGAASRPKITQVFDLQLTPNLDEDGKSTVKFESPIAQVSVTVRELQ